MTPIAAYNDALRAALAVVSIALLAVSVNAYRRRREGRYLLLMLAFAFLCVGSVGTAATSSFGASMPAWFQTVGSYVIPSVELLMGVSFLVALGWSSASKRRAETAFATAVVAVVLVGSMAYSFSAPPTLTTSLPAGCKKPPTGFLIVGTSSGYNDSEAHGAPLRPWPILNVANGSDVTITVCNAYSDPVGFQVAHYFDSKTESINPGQAITVNFVADKTGTFPIYCLVFSPVHVYLQGGEVNVTPN